MFDFFIVDSYIKGQLVRQFIPIISEQKEKAKIIFTIKVIKIFFCLQKELEGRENFLFVFSSFETKFKQSMGTFGTNIDKKENICFNIYQK